jgi:hypothetical protein
VIPVADMRRVCVDDGMWTCSLRPDLEKIPYGDLFEANNHANVRNNDDSFEFSVKCDIIWHKSRVVKRTIESTTV